MRERGQRLRIKAWLIRAGVVALSLILAWGIAGLPLYVFPVIDTPRQSDVIVVLGPPVQTRVAFAQRMAEAGFADRIVISVPTTGQSSKENLSACNETFDGYTVSCFTPKPFTTQGEARMLQTLSGPWQIDRAIVITNNPHVTRARLLFDRCFEGESYILTDSSTRNAFEWVYQYFYQTAAFAKALSSPDC